jgi:hypothetical protein
MTSIIWNGLTYHGISVDGRGVFTDKYGGGTKAVIYAGQHTDGYACGLAVATYSDGAKEFAEHGSDGQFDGRYLQRFADGVTYGLYERGEEKDSAYVYADGRCKYKYKACAPDDPRLLALIAQVAPVEVRPAAPTPHPPLAPKQSSVGSAARFALAGAGDRCGHRGASPRSTRSLMAV